ncbi:MAG: amidase, partial [Mesorhizobium sp.]
ARSVADCAIADAIMAGEEPAALQPSSLAGLRVGIPRGALFGETQAEVAEAFESCIDRIGRASASATDLSIDDLIAEMRAATKRGTIASMEGAEVHADWLASGASVPVDPHVTGPLSRALAVPASAYIRTIRRRGELAAAMAERLEAVDLLALPTVPMVAPSIAAMAGDEALRDRTEGLLLRNTQVANQFDLCAISLPMPGTKLPAGLMLVGRHGEDRRLLAIAAGVEALLSR